VGGSPADTGQGPLNLACALIPIECDQNERTGTLIEIARELPPAKVHALLKVAEQMTEYVSDERFLGEINSTPPLDVDEETAEKLRAVLSGRAETISHEELKHKLGLG
jgi:hypothetical protein